MKVEPTSLPGVLLVEPTVIADERGFFMESWHRAKFAAAGLAADFVQDNHSSSRRGVLRGLHYQRKRPQGKLVRVVSGEIVDVAVDLRRSSPTFGRSVIVALSAATKRQLWIPAGFAHGFYVTSDTAELVYKCTEFYDGTDERTIRWDDPDLAIAWPIESGVAPIVSEKDRAGCAFADAECFA
ncbi:MAG: dTDP-4-dehydrorhamnose 3,5-epimerase [Gemmatimonadota bacterium]